MASADAMSTCPAGVLSCIFLASSLFWELQLGLRPPISLSAPGGSLQEVAILTTAIVFAVSAVSALIAAIIFF
jgi:hypothetical protein